MEASGRRGRWSRKLGAFAMIRMVLRMQAGNGVKLYALKAHLPWRTSSSKAAPPTGEESLQPAKMMEVILTQTITSSFNLSFCKDPIAE